jgi:MAF protein
MLILASNSPRRKQLLTLGGWNFQVKAAEVDERQQPGESPPAYVLRLAIAKARAVAAQLTSLAGDSQIVVLAADTAVVLEEHGRTFILGKPQSGADARRMLTRLRGRTHQVMTGLAALCLGPATAASLALATDLCTTVVAMRSYSEAEMQAYIASGDPFDKAGAYAIQHSGFNPVERLEGCFANVAGLPVCRLEQLLMSTGFAVPPGRHSACKPGESQCQFAGEF